ncbi:hypothetical protein COLO4_09326 [Corchorus olitorius]|uniref:Uncharacterized protein n=1 Tax=Corchorus olitorius TaxID=93759 RepID=A0A1R3KCD3_9ROSI|nr:hypothetical protein COLO4_09326 [Corchorus olitorius]
MASATTKLFLVPEPVSEYPIRMAKRILNTWSEMRGLRKSVVSIGTFLS